MMAACFNPYSIGCISGSLGQLVWSVQNRSVSILILLDVFLEG
jgi:hypothetical protein